MGRGPCRVPTQVPELRLTKRPQSSREGGRSTREPSGSETIPAQCFPRYQERMGLHPRVSQGKGVIVIGGRERRRNQRVEEDTKFFFHFHVISYFFFPISKATLG